MSSAGGHPVSFFGLFSLPELLPKNKHLGEFLHEMHKVMAVAILAFLSIHVLAALKHTLVDRDSTLKRILGLFRVHDLLIHGAIQGKVARWRVYKLGDEGSG